MTIIIISVLLAAVGLAWRIFAVKKLSKLGPNGPVKKLNISKTLATVLIIVSVWFLALQVISVIFKLPESEAFGISVLAQRVNVFGLNLSNAIIVTWIAMGILVLAALVLRIFIIPHMKNAPAGVQSMLEATIEGKRKNGKRRVAGDSFRTYIFTVIVLLITYLAIEFFGTKTPVADVTLIAAVILAGLLILILIGIRLFLIMLAKKSKEPKTAKDTIEDRKIEKQEKKAQLELAKRQQVLEKESKPRKKLNALKRIVLTAVILSVWFFVIRILEIVFGTPAGQMFGVSLGADRVNILGADLSNTIVVTWLAMAIIILISLFIRVFAVTQARRKPKGIQAAIEVAVDGNNVSAESKAKNISEKLRSYVYTAVILLITYTAIELVGLTKITADITLILTLIVVGVLALIGLSIRIKNLAKREQLMLEKEINAEAAEEKEKEHQAKRNKTIKKLIITAVIASVWFFLVRLLELIFGTPEAEGIKVSIWAERVNVFGLNLSTTIIITWIAIIVLIVASLLIRMFVMRKMKDVPKGAQNVIEIAVEGIAKYTKSTAGNLGENLGAYIFAVSALLVTCAVVELFGFRAPTADITLTFALSINTFILINYYGIKEKGVFGRMKSLAAPSPLILPFKIIGDLAIPISMSARLFGNMFGGLIVMDLLYSALGGGAIGIPSVVGLYFNVFHPLIQAFIFITLTLTFIGEATE
ncbi:MAG: FoF1 ATP synthase subunit a [Eubacteriales bacterium]